VPKAAVRPCPWIGPLRRRESEWGRAAVYFLKLVVASYLLMRLILYMTRVLAGYFVDHVWRFW